MAAPPTESLQAVLQDSLSQLRAVAPRRQPALAEACDAALAKLKASNASGVPALEAPSCLQILKTACELEGSPNAVCMGLHSCQRLMPIGYFAGSVEEAGAQRLLIDNVIEVICGCSEQAHDDVQMHLVRAISTAVISPVCEVHGKSLIRAVSACFKIYKNAGNQANQQKARANLMQIVGTLVQLSRTAQPPPPSPAGYPKGDEAKAEDSELASWVMVPNPPDESRDQWVASFLNALIDQVVVTAKARPRKEASELSLQLRDALQVLLSFSKQSMKDPVQGQGERQFLRSKRISLQMVLCMLETADQSFLSSEHCVRILTQNLFPAVIKNSLSSLPDVFELSLKIFGILVVKCRRWIRREIGVFITQVLLQILSSGNSTYQHKAEALQAIQRMCADASVAIEVFLNFDCDLEGDNVFEIIVERLSQIAQGKYAASEHTSLIDPEQENELKTLALKSLVTLASALTDWAYKLPEAMPGAADGLPVIMERRKRKLALKRAVEKFNMHPKKGVVDLREAGFITEEPESLASLFQKSSTGLSKTEVGDYLGDNKPFNIKVLQCLIDCQDFSGLGVDGGMRQLLSSFRLPGEAQKIDRIIDGFAKKYTLDNPGSFANSDTAHILAFSVMMLQTDLHSDQIKNKMTKPAFVSNNRGINDGKDLPREYLEGLYDAVAATPFSLKEDDDARLRVESQQAQTAAQKLQIFARETEDIVQNACMLLQQCAVANSTAQHYVAARTAEHACPAFGAACWPLLAAFSTVLQEVDEQTEEGIMELCVEGLRDSVRIAARFDMHTKRDALVSALAMFTYLMTLKEIKQKNVECIKALLSIALLEGNRLGASWQHVLQCMSRLEQLQLISAKSQPDYQYFGGQHGGSAAKATVQGAVGRSVGAAGITTLLSTGLGDEQVEQANSVSVMSQVDSALIDRLFFNTSGLDSETIVGFVVQLVRVSREELATPDKPRVFSLHKLVEVADYNMGRTSAVWSKLWGPLSQHLVEVAAHKNEHLSMYAVDSLRQLATRFLDKDDTAASDLHVAVLRPFEVMMLSTRNMTPSTKSYVVDAVLYIVQSRTHKIRSGWKIVLHILRVVCKDITDEEVVLCGFTAVTAGLRDRCLLEEHFQDTILTISTFATCQVSVAASLEAVKCLRQAADHLSSSQGGQSPPAGVDQSPAGAMMPILRYLSDLVRDPRKDIKGAALETLFEILENSACFDGAGWQSVLSDIIKPLFEALHNLLKTEQAAGFAYAAPLYVAALKALTRISDTCLAVWPPGALEAALGLVQRAARHDGEAVGNAAVADAARECLRTLARFAADRKDEIDAASVVLLEVAAKELLQRP